MRLLLALLLLGTLGIVSAQDTDSLALNQVDSLIKISRELTGRREFEKALAVNAEAERIALEAFGPESAAYGTCCFNQGRVLYFKGDFTNAEKWYLKSRRVREKALGKEHPDYAWSLNNLAILYHDMGQYEKAELLHIEARAIREKTLGKEHPDYASSLDNLAVLYRSLGQYFKAELLYIEVRAIREQTLGNNHPGYARTLNNLAVLYTTLGQYEQAEPLYIEARAIMEKALGKEHPEYASSLNNLAVLYFNMGQYDKVEPLYAESKTIKEKALGKEHPEYANILNNLASLYIDIGQYHRAEPLYIEARAIMEKALGKEHPDYAGSLNKLAVLYWVIGQYEKAEPLYIEARAIREKALGKEHPDYADILNNLALLYEDMCQYKKAELMFIEARAIREKALGKEHPDYANSLNNLAILYNEMGQYKKAEPFYQEHSTVVKRMIEKALVHLSESEISYFLNKFSNSQYQVFSFIHSTGSKNIIPACYDNSLFYKGFLLQAADRLKQLALSDPATADQFNLLKGYRRRLAAQYAKPIAERDSALVDQLETRANDLEKDLARSAAGFAEAQRQVSWQEVQAALPEDAVALEFVHFRVNFPARTDSVMYAALLLRPGAGEPVFIPLFEEKELDHLLDGDRERKADYVNELYARADRGMVQLGSEKQTLYDLIWAKIEAAGLEGIATVYYSPSGVLHRLNLGAIAVDEETILSDKYHLVALNSTRQLVIPSTVTTKPNDALLVGGVNFEMDSVQISQKEQPLLASRAASESWTESGSRGDTWSYLKWTEKEVDRIGASLAEEGFTVARWSGKEATEEAVKSIGMEGPSPRILHIATHGFFFPDPEIAPSSRRGLGEVEPVFKWSDNPMIRSGLILAGGNYAWQNGRAPHPDMEDGILTAYEISQMNLSNTELVVLSACETGLGDIRGNEGVYGLQRAFKIAGAKYLIMSLWQVPDRETMEFMTAFYRNWLPAAAEALAGKEEQMTVPEAFRKTQREMRDRFYNPYSWAGFVLVE